MGHRPRTNGATASDPAYPEWRKFLKEDDLKALKDAGLDFPRMPVDPSPFLSDRTIALRDDLYASVLDSARRINRAGLKVIVDLDLVPAGGNRKIGMGQVMDDLALIASITSCSALLPSKASTMPKALH